jgi:hypothetical protein
VDKRLRAHDVGDTSANTKSVASLRDFLFGTVQTTVGDAENRQHWPQERTGVGRSLLHRLHIAN